jgi:MFS family permease
MSNTLPKPDPYAPWRNPDFRRYACSWFAMTFSKQIETLAVSVYFVSIYDLSDASLALGAMGLVQALPVMLLAIAGGQLADRFQRRRVIISMLSLGTVSSAGLLVVAILHAPVSWIYLLLGIGATAQALGSPSRAALLPQLLPAEQFSTAVTWNSTVFYMGAVTGPAVGGVILAMSKDPAMPLIENPAPAFVVVLACRFVALAAITLVRYRQVDRSGEPISWDSVVAGIRFVWRTKLILATITLDMFAVLLGGVTYLLPIYAKDILHVGSTGLGLLRSADAIGAVCMAVLLAHMPPMRRAGVALLWAIAGYGLATIIFGFSEWFWLSLLMMFMIGALDNISVVVRHTLVQMLTPDEMRGRVSAVHGVFIVASNDLGGLESGLAAWLVGPVIAVVGGGVGTILVVLGATRLWPQILSLGSLTDIRPAAEGETSHVE